MSLIYNATFDSQTRVLSLLDKAGNVISSCEVPSKSNELKLTATKDNSSVKLTKNGTLSNTYEVNTGSGWQSYTFGTVIPLNAGESCKWRCSAHSTTQTIANYVQFVMTGKIEASGNCNSMLNSDFEGITSLSGYDYAFCGLFQRCTSLTHAPELPSTTLSPSCYLTMFNGCTSLIQAPNLPATMLSDCCYLSMFFDCTSLIQAPNLPATTLAESCYKSMFYGCTSLINAPELPATTLADQCYYTMFKGCTSLKQAPSLPATTLAESCYYKMFYECTSLVQAPELPALSIPDSSLSGREVYGCYVSMFEGCRSLVQAPALPATTLGKGCYVRMFYGCTSLNEIRVSATDISANNCTANWVRNVSSTGDFYCNPDTAWTTGSSGIPSGWNRVNEGAPSVDDITKPLTFKATQDGSTVSLTKNGSPTGDFQTSRDGGNTWTDYTIDTAITLNTGDEVSFRAKTDRTSAQTNDTYFKFNMTGKIEAWHNVMSLYRTNDFSTYNTVVDYAFNRLFQDCTSLTKAPELPATTLAVSCYIGMFYGCTSLTKAPELPATTLANKCYKYMFNGCTSLAKAPELPATTLEQSCYDSMFNGCTSLAEAPVLPSTTLAQYCYSHMFQGCRSLTKAPALPATTLATYCYNSMFSGCASLTEAPVLPATTLAVSCYNSMFLNCSSLKEVRISATTTANSALFVWLSGVSATGDFYCDPNATIFPSGSDGIPSGWRRLNIADYPQT